MVDANRVSLGPNPKVLFPFKRIPGQNVGNEGQMDNPLAPQGFLLEDHTYAPLLLKMLEIRGGRRGDNQAECGVGFASFLGGNVIVRPRS